MAEEPENGKHNYKDTEWRAHVNYRFDELKQDFQEVTRKIDAVIVMGIVTPATLDQKLKDQREACAAQFKNNPNSNGLKGGWSLAKWGIKEFGVFGFLATIIVGLFILLMSANGLIG